MWHRAASSRSSSAVTAPSSMVVASRGGVGPAAWGSGSGMARSNTRGVWMDAAMSVAAALRLGRRRHAAPRSASYHLGLSRAGQALSRAGRRVPQPEEPSKPSHATFTLPNLNHPHKRRCQARRSHTATACRQPTCLAARAAGAACPGCSFSSLAGSSTGGGRNNSKPIQH